MSDDRTDTPPEAPATDRPVKLPAKLEADHGGVLAIIPRSIDEAQRLASGLIASGIVPDAFRVDGRNSAPNAPLVLMGVLKSMEVGLPPITGIGSLLPINNRFAIWGDGAVALAQRHIQSQTARRIGPSFDPKTELADWPGEFGWTVSYWRVGQSEPYVGTFTVQDARRANLWLNARKQPWIMYPERMLYNRARAFALRDGFADALMGLGIAEEERDRLPDVQDGGALKAEPGGVPDYLRDEPVTEALEHQPTVETTITPEPETVQRDLGTEADRGKDF